MSADELNKIAVELSDDIIKIISNKVSNMTHQDAAQIIFCILSTMIAGNIVFFSNKDDSDNKSKIFNFVVQKIKEQVFN